MPFDGNRWNTDKMVSYQVKFLVFCLFVSMHSDTQEMLEIIRKTFPTFRRVEDAPNDTSKGWKVPGFLGQVGGF